MSAIEPNVVIAPSTPEHLPAIAALADVIWRAHYPGIITMAQIDYMLPRMYSFDVLKKELAEGICYDRILVNGDPKGFASYGPIQTGEMKLYKLYIHPDWQRHGLGTSLLRHVEKVSRARRFQTLLLTVNKRNEKAVAAYLKNGFTVRESVTVEIGRGFVMDDFIMVKPL
jgi:diamine N-acetyltransferase